MPILGEVIDDVNVLVQLYSALADLPSADLSCQFRLPHFLSPELERLRWAIDHEDLDEHEDALPVAVDQVDTPMFRADLARAVIALREAGKVSDEVAAIAFLDLGSEGQALVRESLLVALAVDCGAARTPSGLLLAG